jgi:hypothetical protein
MQKSWLAALLVLLLLLFYGCAVRTVNIKNYQLNEIKSVNVGDPIIKVGHNLKEEMYFIPLVDISERLGKEEFYIPLEPPYEGIYDEKDGSFFVILDRHELFSVKVDTEGRVISKQKYFDYEEKLFEPAPNYFGIANSKLYELSYSGRIGDHIVITYKEYYVEMADVKRKIDQIRPGFSEQITYDLSESDEIVYKEFRIRIHEANSEQIRFEILMDTSTD